MCLSQWDADEWHEFPQLKVLKVRHFLVRFHESLIVNEERKGKRPQIFVHLSLNNWPINKYVLKI